MIAIEDYVELAVRGLEMSVHGSGSQEILIQAAREIKWLRSNKCFEESDWEEKA